MPLIDLKTDLKSLRYGKDTLGGGWSGQPYIKKSIPDSAGDLFSQEDFILRGGANAVSDSITDVSRLTQMFFDLKSPNGLFFIAKQQLLSRTSVRTQTSGILNEGAYSPLNTLSQAGVNALGIHLKKQGINPFAGTGAYSNNDNLYGVKVKTDQELSENRLWRLKESIDYGSVSILDGITLNSLNGTNILSYGGGPGSSLGIGNTNIRFASPEQRTGEQNKYFKKDKSFFLGKGENNNTPHKWETDDLRKDYNFSGSVSGIYGGLTNQFVDNGFTEDGKREGTYFFNVYDPNITPGNTWPNQTPLVFSNGNNTLDQNQINDLSDSSQFTGIRQIDFRKELRNKNGVLTQTIPNSIISKSPSYSEGNGKTIDGGTGLGRVNQLSPGIKGNILSYTKGKLINGTNNKMGPIDRINALPIYSSENVTGNNIKNDLVKFRIAAINNNSPNFKTFMHFRALLGAITDSYNSTWNPTQYLGRGEDFYTYGGFSRSVSLSWTVVAQSKDELIPMYKKLNYLASTMAPDYSGNGYMRGNLMQLTIGGYFYEQKGFFTTLDYSMPQDTTWEIGINDSGNYDSTVKELAHRIEVTAAFTPIHNFIPKKMVNEETKGVTGDGTFDSNKYGPERFIALATHSDTNLSNYGPVYNSSTPATKSTPPEAPEIDDSEAPDED
tara:strand:+ start:1462 stop:3462 length:2001 start_codon:yes stop_codon:yes gene_type:complete